MPSYRTARSGEDVMRELSVILRELKDPRVQDAMLSIVKVDLARDLTSCKVYVSSMKGAEAAKEAVKALKNAQGFVRKELGARVQMRHTPELRFITDDSIEYSAGIAKLLNDIKSEDNHED